MRRVVNAVLAAVGLVCLSPLIVTCWFLAKVQSGGSGFFTQQRVGMNGEAFRVYKLRTMYADRVGSTTTVAGDARVTPAGRWMRRYKVDEIPQLINVLNGTMSLVGPRPTVREDFDRMTDQQRGRFAVRPGMTGLAQISGNTALSWPERIEHDLLYVSSASMAVDLRIIVATLALVVRGDAETHPVSKNEWEA